jgi:hypothetical protein
MNKHSHTKLIQRDALAYVVAFLIKPSCHDYSVSWQLTPAAQAKLERSGNFVLVPALVKWIFKISVKLLIRPWKFGWDKINRLAQIPFTSSST